MSKRDFSQLPIVNFVSLPNLNLPYILTMKLITVIMIYTIDSMYPNCDNSLNISIFLYSECVCPCGFNSVAGCSATSSIGSTIFVGASSACVGSSFPTTLSGAGT